MAIRSPRTVLTNSGTPFEPLVFGNVATEAAAKATAVKKIDNVDAFMETLEQFKDVLDQVEVFHSQILVAKYIRTTVGTSGSLIAPTISKKEDMWQGKAGIVVKIGPGAFKDDSSVKFYGTSVKIGDWVMYRNTDGWDFNVKPRVGSAAGMEIPCRFLDDIDVKGRVPRPDILW
jgi:co-chaperonin GroES (HSP10)